MAVHSDPGFGSGEEDNQDVALGLTRLSTGSSSSSVVALFDGHGPCGREVASLARSAVVGLLQTRLDGVLNGQPVAAGYSASFAALDAAACAEADAAESGSSATVIIHDLQSSTIHVANVGDSKAVCARVDAESGIIQHRQLTADHYPGVAEERERIIAAGGRVAATDDVQLGELGEVRVWRGTSNAPGVAFSRSIGDAFAKDLGVIAEPAVTSSRLRPDDRFLVLASAGVWKVIPPSEIVNVAAAEPDTAAAASAIVEEAQRRWAQLWQGENTTAIVLVFPSLDDARTDAPAMARPAR